MEQGLAISSADAIVMAVSDRLIGKILKTFVKDLRPGAKVVMLDAAAPHAGELPEREDSTYFVTHPCHPPIFNDETEPKAKTDYFGGVHAKQHIVCALMQGPEFALRRMLARFISRSYARTGVRSSSSPFSNPRFQRRSARRSRSHSERRRTRLSGTRRRNRPRSTSSLVTSTLSLRSRSEFFRKESSRTALCRRSTRPSRLSSVTDGSTAFLPRRLCSSRSRTFARLRLRERFRAGRRAGILALVPLRQAGQHRG